MRIPHPAEEDEFIADNKDGNEYAAVAIVIHDKRIILQKRSSTRGDPWAGQFSLPGGHYSKRDRSLKDTAIRETMEETGVDLEYSRYMGHFGPFTPGNRHNLRVYAYVFELERPQKLVSSDESEFLIWVKLQELVAFDGDYGRSYRIKEGIIWGLTARIIDRFKEIYGTGKW
ncbi:MAG: CoA pyrophosphatase [Candidatus Thermoplasmatota archaeon]|jgi:8-oxo-dGTP pyrophosphatase MutT (NUDIX family)|nr:CoA pyrophosphatase [Candidatus Thermoplasmatota archaeon]